MKIYCTSSFQHKNLIRIEQFCLFFFIQLLSKYTPVWTKPNVCENPDDLKTLTLETEA